MIDGENYAEGRLGKAVRSSLSQLSAPIYLLSVSKNPMSGKPAALLDYEAAIIRKVKERI